jgi:hypothetical protein
MFNFKPYIISEKCPSDAADGHGGAEKDQIEYKRNQIFLRPLSMNITRDQAGNPYVDLRSKVATASPVLPSEGVKA